MVIELNSVLRHVGEEKVELQKKFETDDLFLAARKRGVVCPRYCLGSRVHMLLCSEVYNY